MPARPAKPPLFDRIIATVSPTVALQRAIARDRLVMFGYDAANPGTARGSSGGMAKNGGSESPQMATDRIKLMWDARDLERNMPVIRCVLDRLVQYICDQILYQSQTGDPEIDSQYESYFAAWADRADVTGRHNLRMLAELAVRSMLRDGDFGFNIVRVGEEIFLQTIESDRIGDPNKVSNEMEENKVQGIHLDPLTGRPIAYDIYRRERKSNRYILDSTIPAENFIFLSKPMRSDEYRGVSWLAPVIGQARDLYEMFSFERGAAKWAASIAGVITVTDPHASGSAGSAGMWDGTTPTGGPAATVEGNKLLRLKPNESVTVFNTGARPSGAFAAYLDASLRDIAMGLNVPYGFFNMAQFGGATVRLEAMQLQRTFKRFQEILVSKCLNRIRDVVIQNGIALGHIPNTPNWNSGRWQFGPHLTADTGYDTDANLTLLQSGLKTASAIAGEEGYDYEDLVDQQIREAIILRDKCAQAGIPVEMVAMGRYPDATAQLQAVQQALQPPSGPTVGDMGEGGVKNLIDVLEKAANGTLPYDEAVALLVSVYEFTPESAKAIVPQKQALAVKANLPSAPMVKPASEKSAQKPEDDMEDGEDDMEDGKDTADTED